MSSENKERGLYIVHYMYMQDSRLSVMAINSTELSNKADMCVHAVTMVFGLSCPIEERSLSLSQVHNCHGGASQASDHMYMYIPVT